MILYFSGTGNSRYVARRMADALHEPLCNMNDRIKAGDTAPVETGARLIIVTPTYAWRIPRIVQDWLLRTALTGTAQAWFVMTCGSEIGSADKYNRALCQEKHLTCMGTAQIIMPENYIAMFNAPQAEEARQIVARAEPDIDRAIAAVRAGTAFPPTRDNLYDRFMSGPESYLLFLLREGGGLHRIGRLRGLRPVRSPLPHQQHHPAKRTTRLGRKLHPLHGLHLLLPRRGHRVWQKEPGQAPVSF